MWWALIEEVAQRAEVMACEMEMACCVRGYHVYKDYVGSSIWGSCLCVARSQPTQKNSHCKIIHFLCTKNFRTKIKQIMVGLGMKLYTITTIASFWSDSASKLSCCLCVMYDGHQ